MSKKIIAKIVLRHDTTENWAKIADTTILLKGEIGLEYAASGVKMKIGDGESLWKDLPYYIAGSSGTAELPDSFTWGMLLGELENGETTYTENLQLTKPALSDMVDVSILNANADLIDMKIATLEENFNSQFTSLEQRLEEIQENLNPTPDTYFNVYFYNGDNSILDTQTVRKGEDAVDPIEKGMETPVKESTEESDFVFSGWDKIFTNVQANLQVYPVFTSKTKEHKVYFLNDTVILEEKMVPHGSYASYDGDTSLIKKVIDGVEQSGYEFIGWNPSPDEPITEETYFYAQFLFNDYLTESWDDILENINSGNLDNYGIGCRKQFEITNEDGTTTVLEAEVKGINHDTLVEVDDSYNQGNETAALTFICQTILKEPRNMNSTMRTSNNISSYNVGGWNYSDLRTWLQNDFFNSLPEDLRNIIKPVYKKSDLGYSTVVVKQTADTIWIPSVRELNCEDSIQTTPGQGQPYAMYTNNESRIKTNLDGERVPYWTRSTPTKERETYCFINTEGAVETAHAKDGIKYVAIGFCI